MIKYTGERALNIIKYQNSPYIILEFDHKNNTAILEKWLHPIKVEHIRALYIYLLKNPERRLVLSMDDLEKCEVLLSW